MNIRMTLCAAPLAAALLTAACDSIPARTSTQPPRNTVIGAGSSTGGATTASTPPTGQPGGRPSPTSTTVPGRRTTAPRQTAPPTARTTGHGAPPECTKASGLIVRPGSTDASAGHRREVLVFTNTGHHTCLLVGYPGVDAISASGHAVARARRTLRGYEGGVMGNHPTQVTLAPGMSASAVVEALGFVPATGNRCTPYAGLLVTAPDDTRSTRVAWPDTDSCADLQVHPVVAGSNG